MNIQYPKRNDNKSKKKVFSRLFSGKAKIPENNQESDNYKIKKRIYYLDKIIKVDINPRVKAIISEIW